MTEAEMNALLDKWAAHEPDRCGWTTPGYSQRWVRAGSDRDYFFVEGRSTTPALLAAVIEAIEARGWWWNVGTTLQEPVQAYVQSPERTFRPVRAETPAAALLGAYLAALEAEAGQ